MGAIGSVTAMRGGATITSTNGLVRQLVLGSKVFEGDIVSTNDNGFVIIVFFDGSAVINMGGNSTRIVDTSIPAPVSTNAWTVSDIPAGQTAFKEGDTVDVTLTMSEALQLPADTSAIKVVIDGKDFILDTTKTNAAALAAGKLVFSYTVANGNNIKVADFDIDDSSAITLTNIIDNAGNQAALTGTIFPVELGSVTTGQSQNIALGSKGLVKITTSVTNWWDGESIGKNLDDIVDGNTSTSRTSNWAIHPLNANGEHILFDFKGVDYTDGVFIFYNRANQGAIVGGRINDSTVEFLKDGVVVGTHTITNAGNVVTIAAVSGVVFDQVKLTFSGNAQNFREIEIMGKEVTSTYSIDAITPSSPLVKLANDTGISASDNITQDGSLSVTTDFKLTEIVVKSGGAYIANNLTYTIQLDSTFKSGDKLWAKFSDGTYMKGVQLQIDINTDNTVTLTAIQARYIVTTNVNVDFDTVSTSRTWWVAESASAAGYGVANAVVKAEGINGTQTTSAINSYITTAGVSTPDALGEVEAVSYQYFVTKGLDAELGAMTKTEYQIYIDNRTTLKGADDGNYIVRVVATSVTGNTSETSSSFTLDTSAPTPVNTNAWEVSELPTGQSAFKVDDVINLTLTTNEILTLGDITGSKVAIAGKDFVLNKSASTAAGNSKLVFQYTVELGDSILPVDFNIDNPSYDITLNNVTDTAGNAPIFTVNKVELGGGYFEQTGDSNPFNGIDVGLISRPTLADIDGDGDLDLVAGDLYGALKYYENTGTSDNPIYNKQTGNNNPFSNIDTGQEGGYSSPVLADIDNDGDLDLVLGYYYGALKYYQNTGTSVNPVYTKQGGTGNPFDNIDVGWYSTPTLADINDDGNLDLVVGERDGSLNYYKNTGTNDNPIYTEQTGGSNPFNGIAATWSSAPTLGDVDGDGDIDLVVGGRDGRLNYYKNTGTSTNPVYEVQTGSDNPFNGVNVGRFSAPTLADVNDDGYLDLVVGKSDGTLKYYYNKSVSVDATPAPTPISTNAWKVDGLPTGQSIFKSGDIIDVTLTMSEALILGDIRGSKIVISGQDFDLNAAKSTLESNDNELVFSYTVQDGDMIDTVDFDIDSSSDIILTGITNTRGKVPDLSSINSAIELGVTIGPSQNIALGSKDLATITTNIIRWWDGEGSEKNLSDIVDSNTSTSGTLNYAIHPQDANGKHILFDFKGINYTDGVFIFYNRANQGARVGGRINDSIVEFLKDGVAVDTQTITNAGSVVKITAASETVFDQVKLTFSGGDQNFREIEIDAKEVIRTSIDTTPPVSANTWEVTSIDADDVYLVGDTIEVTLTLDKAVSTTDLIASATSTVTINGIDFILSNVGSGFTSTTATSTKLVFTHVVEMNESTSATDFNIDNANAINLNDAIKDAIGNTINVTNGITYPIELGKSSVNINIDFTTSDIGGTGTLIDNGTTFTKNVGDSTKWDTDLFSTENFIGDGYVITKINSINEHMVLGLSTDDTDNSKDTVDYGIYINRSNIEFVSESGTNISVGASAISNVQQGDYIKVARVGTEIHYIYITAIQYASNSNHSGTTIKTTIDVSDTSTLHFDSSFKSVNSSVSDIQMFNGRKVSIVTPTTDRAVDVPAPKPIAIDAWEITSVDADGIYYTGDIMKITLTLDRIVSAKNLTASETSTVTINGMDFILSNTDSGFYSTTNISTKLVFTRTIIAGDSASTSELNINSIDAISIDDNIRDRGHKNIDFTNGDYPIALVGNMTNIGTFKNMHIRFTESDIGGQGEITDNGTTFEHLGTGKFAEIFSQDSFVGYGYIIARYNSVGHALIFGLSTDNTDDTHRTIDYGVMITQDRRIHIYESGGYAAGSSLYMESGDYIKIARIGTEIHYSIIRAAEYATNPNQVGTILRTAKGVSFTSALHFDSSFITVGPGARLEDIQMFDDVRNPPSIITTAPKPITTDAWKITSTNLDGVYHIGDIIKITLILDEAVSSTNLTASTTSEVTINGLNFTLSNTDSGFISTSATSTKLVFTHTVVAGNTTSGADFDIDSAAAINISNSIKDASGNNINLNTTSYPVELGGRGGVLTPTFTIGGIGDISDDGTAFIKDTGYTSWDTDIFSIESFVGDGYVIAQINSNNKVMAFGLSTDDSSNSFDTIDYAFFIEYNGAYVYESGHFKLSHNLLGGAGDYMKIARIGTTIHYILITAEEYAEDPNHAGTTARITKGVSATTALHLDSSFYSVNASLSDIQMFNGTSIDASPLSIDLNNDGIINYQSLDDSIAHYDLDGDGKLEHTAWVDSQDGLIGYDVNSDGKISGREELVLSDYIAGAKTDLEGMHYFDTNKDGLFTQADNEWNTFKVWQDKNSNGISDKGEVISLNEAGINKIELTSDNNKQILANGDVTEYGQFNIHYSNGAQGIGGDTAFSYENTQSLL